MGWCLGLLSLARVNRPLARVYAGFDIGFDFHGAPPFHGYLGQKGLGFKRLGPPGRDTNIVGGLNAFGLPFKG